MVKIRFENTLNTPKCTDLTIPCIDILASPCPNI